MPAGPASVTGEVTISGLKSTYLDKMVMLITDEEGHVISFDKVSESGTFGFPTLAYGTYYIYGEMVGITSQHIKVVLTPENPHADVVMTLSGKNIMGTGNTITEAESVLIYPNPANDKVNFVMNPEKTIMVTADIYDMKGMIVSSDTRSIGPGKSLVTISVTDLAPGFYTLRISAEKGINISRKLLITK
jgi:hypothetical protein